MKRFDALCDSVLNGSMDAEELSDDLLEIVVKEIRRRQRTRGKGRKSAKPRAVKSVAPISGHQVYVELEEVSTLGEEMVSRALRSVGARRCEDRLQASFFWVRDPLHPGQWTDWHCGLSGGTLVDADYVCSGGTKGVAAGYEATGATNRRFVHMTAAFRARFPELENAVRRRTRWRLLDEAGLAATKHRFVEGRAAELWVFVSMEEFQDRPPDLHGVKYVLFEKLARAFVCNTVLARSKFNVGECSRACWSKTIQNKKKICGGAGPFMFNILRLTIA